MELTKFGQTTVHRITKSHLKFMLTMVKMMTTNDVKPRFYALKYKNMYMYAFVENTQNIIENFSIVEFTFVLLLNDHIRLIKLFN